MTACKSFLHMISRSRYAVQGIFAKIDGCHFETWQIPMHLKTLLALTLTFLISAPLVFLLEVWLFDFAPIVTARSIIGIYVLYYALTLGEILLVNHFRRTSPASVLGIYMASKGLRFLITVAIILLYGILKGPDFIAFTANVFICFIVTLVFTTICHMKEETKHNPLS